MNAIRAEQLHAMLLDELTQRLASGGTVGDDRLGIGAVADFPALTNAFAGRNGLAIPGQRGPTPEAFNKNWLKLIWIEHVPLAVVVCFT